MRSAIKWIVGVGLVVLLAAGIAALTLPRSGDHAALGPGNPGPTGARALVQILRRQGVQVTQLRNSQDVADAAGTGTAVLVTDTTLLGPDQLDRLAGRSPSDLILVAPDDFTLSRVAPEIHALGAAPGDVQAPACSQPDAMAAGSARGGGQLYATAGVPACYPSGLSDGAGSYLVTDTLRSRITVIGQPQVLENQFLDQDGNAALALRSLGRDPKLVWYTPDPLELGGSGQAPSLFSQVPGWVLWIVVQLVVVVLAAMIWRGRRLGPLVAEPLPIVVRAAETVEGRARLYRQSRARGRAAATLRTTALRRLATRLAAPSGISPEQLAALVATRTGRDDVELRALLLGPAPESDADLVTLADRLDGLERDVRRSASDLRGSSV
jgi:hypothetical protein